MMIDRPFWRQRLEDAWREAPIAWLCGVRRSGKTTLAESFGPDHILYVNCDLPVTEDRVGDPEFFFRSASAPIVVFDEVHQLREPARLLKVGADRFPHLKILATGSSTLAASRKFRDTLAGRKRVVHLLPALWDELPAFGVSIHERLFRGGLPDALLAGARRPALYREWIDSFFARDIQRLFGFRDMNRFNTLFEYLIRQSGGVFEATRFARDCEASRTTITNYIAVLEATFIAHVVRPFSSRRSTEIISVPKVYAFDTGFVCHYRGWDTIRSDDLGVLWEHFVLNEFHARLQSRDIRYWRDKRQHEIDFVMQRRGKPPTAIECKWSADGFDARNLAAFRLIYPRGENFVVCQDVQRPYRRTVAGLDLEFVGLEGLIARLQAR